MDISRILRLEEYKKLSKLFQACDFVEPDDTDLHEAGNHRELFDYLRHDLNFAVTAGRGPAYHFASDLLAENKEYAERRIVYVLLTRDDNLAQWAKFMMGFEQ